MLNSNSKIKEVVNIYLHKYPPESEILFIIWMGLETGRTLDLQSLVPGFKSHLS